MTIIKGIHNGTETNIKATFDGDLIVRAVTEEEIEHSAATGEAFAFHVTEAAIDTTDTVLFLRNDDDAILVLDRATFGTDVAEPMTWQVCLGNATTTPAGGSAITPTNLYQTYSGKTFENICRTDETSVAQGTIVEEHRLGSDVVGSNSKTVGLHGILLGKGHYVQFDIVGTTPVVGMTLWGHWEVEAV